MNEGSNDRRSSPTFAVKATRKGIAISIRCVALFAVLVLVNLPVKASSPSACPGIHIEILEIKNNKGTIGCALFESQDGFPIEYLRFATNIIVLKIRDTQARCDFVDIPAGTYALVVIHDENMNGELDADWLGIPIEGYGFSNDAKAMLGPPTFSEAAFSYQGQDMALSISLNY